MDKVPSIFASENTVYHYCKLHVALEHILFERKLRLSKRKSSLDPIENIKPLISVGGVFGPKGDPGSTIDEHEFIKQLKSKVIDILTSTKQACFCMNDTSGRFKGYLQKPYEYYGFLKPRMWNQYADDYRGVCLAFSLPEIQKGPTINPQKIKYCDYSLLKLNHTGIDLNQLRRLGFKEYEEQVIKSLERILL